MNLLDFVRLFLRRAKSKEHLQNALGCALVGGSEMHHNASLCATFVKRFELHRIDYIDHLSPSSRPAANGNSKMTHAQPTLQAPHIEKPKCCRHHRSRRYRSFRLSTHCCWMSNYPQQRQ